MREVVVVLERMVVRGGDEDVGVDVVVDVSDEGGEEEIRVIRRDGEMAGVGDRSWRPCRRWLWCGRR